MQHEGHGKGEKGCLLGATPEHWAEAHIEAAVYPCAIFFILSEKPATGEFSTCPWLLWLWVILRPGLRD